MPDRPLKHFWYVSRLTRRILAVNIAPLLLLVVGLLYTGQYEKSLIASELGALRAQGRLLSIALAESGSRAALDGTPVLADDLARQMLRKRIEKIDKRVIVFGKTGKFMLDSHQLVGPGGLVQIFELEPPFRSWPLARKARFLGEKALALLPVRLRLPRFPAVPAGQDAQGYPGLLDTLNGAALDGAWRDPDGGILLTASLPVQDLKNVLGAVLVMQPGKSVDESVREVQFAVLRVFFAALLVTLLLSIYLSETIVYPIVRLAEATEKVRHSLFMKDAVPDLSWRKDEIGDLSRAFREMTIALSDRIDAISRFAADVAHEIKNPLASVKSAVETFSRVRDEKQREKLLAVINDDINRITRLITDISNASRLDSELSRAPKAPLDFARLLKDVVAAEGSRIGDPSKIVLYIEEGLRLPVTGNDTQLAQVIHNLVDNALSFVTTEGKVAVSAGLKEGKVFMHVDNAGPPIPESKLETVFERFYSERPKTEKFGLHSGLGLSISRQIVRMHRGEISAQNLKDRSGAAKGVRFTVLLPAGAGTK